MTLPPQPTSTSPIDDPFSPGDETVPNDRNGEESGTPVQWEKVLWRKQPFADNYVPSSFLSELDDVAPRPRPNLLGLIIAALPISQHISTIALFLGIFYALLVGTIGAGQVGWACVGLGGFGWVVHTYGWGTLHRSNNDINTALITPPTPLRQIILPPLLLALFSPILASLTSSTSSDSIWPLSGLLFFVHLLLADFSTGEDNRRRRRRRLMMKAQEEKKRRGSGSEVKVNSYVVEEKSLTSSLSLTSALSASIVLASRLPSTAHVFSLILLSVLLFAGWPNIAKGVRESGKIWSGGLTGSMVLLAISVFPTSPARERPGETTLDCGLVEGCDGGTEGGFRVDGPVIVFLGVVGLVNLLGPWTLWYAWRWKTHRGGRWDAAKVTLKRKEARGSRG